MSKPTKFEPYKPENSNRWILNIPAKFTANGKRQRLFFRLKKDAQAHADGIKERTESFGASSATIAPSLAEDAQRAADILKPWGASLTDAAIFLSAHREAISASRTVADATADFLKACGHLRGRTIQGYRQACDRVKDALGTRMLATLTAEEIVKAADLDSSGASAANRFRCIRAWWKWCAKKGWCDADTIKPIDAPRTASGDEVSTLTPSEVRALLTTAEKHYPEAVASIVLLTFAGIRPEELAKLEAGHVTTSGITIPAGVAKKGRRRFIEASPTLADWLAKYPFKACTNWRQVFSAVRRLAGWQVESRLLADPPPASRGPWPQNCLRHTHASCAIASGIPLESLLFEFGHTGSPAVLRTHYVGRIEKRDALDFFSIRPKSKTSRPKLKIA